MIYVALANAVLLGLALVTFAGIMRWYVRQSARREDLLVNQVCSLAGRPWLPPPAQERLPEEPAELGRYVIPDYLTEADL